MATSFRTSDHEQIRKWAEARKAKPSCVLGTGDDEDPGVIRLDFPGFSGEGKLKEISWEEWFQQFDENNLEMLLQEETADGEQSNFNKIVKKEAAASKSKAAAKPKAESKSRKEARPKAEAKPKTGAKAGTKAKAAAK